MIILDGKKYRDELLEEYKKLIEDEKLTIRLDIIIVGHDEASEIYVRNKVKFASFVGIKVVTHELESTVLEENIIDLIEELNCNEEVTGIILQSPISDGLDFDACASKIAPRKDIDGFTMMNIDKLYHGVEALIPCTVKGIIMLLEHYGVDLEGKNVTIIGRGNIVGKPLALALTNKNATVTLCHSKTENLAFHTKHADIVISATGKRNLVTENMVKDGFIGVDVGINRTGGKICGDFDYEEVKDKASMITPVPGGVGPMTVAMIIDNLIKAKRMEK